MATVKLDVKPAADVPIAYADQANIFVDSADDKVKIKDSAGEVTEVGGSASAPLPEAIMAALTGASPALSATNAVVSAGALTPLSAITSLFMKLTVDPTAGTGVAAAAPKIGIRNNSGVTELWIKTGTGNTNWRLLEPAG